MAVASAGPHANLHLTPDIWPYQYPTTQFLQARCPSCWPTNSVKTLKTTTIKTVKISKKATTEYTCVVYLIFFHTIPSLVAVRLKLSSSVSMWYWCSCCCFRSILSISEMKSRLSWFSSFSSSLLASSCRSERLYSMTARARSSDNCTSTGIDSFFMPVDH